MCCCVQEPVPVAASSSSTEHVVPPAAAAQPTPSTGAVAGPPSRSVGGKPVVVGGIEFAASAKEARERMKKKGNVKHDTSLSLRDKYELLQKL